jgi:chromate transport protein ChrA
MLKEHFILQMKREITKNYTWLTYNKFNSVITITLSLPHLSSSMFADCDPDLYIGYNVC